MNEHGEDLYTEEVQRLLYYFKPKLPKDFPLVTEEREVYIIICVLMEHFAWRTVEDRLAIALTLEELRQSIERTGIGCLIEKVTEAQHHESST